MKRFITAAFSVLLLAGCQHADTHAPHQAEPAPPPPAEAQVDWNDLLPNPRQPKDGVLSGGQPTAGQLAQAAEAGFRTVINLRMPGERGADDEEAQVAQLGMEYVHMPINGAEGITEENARELSRLLETSEQPVLLHCGSGNRVGALLALSAYHVEGASAEEALQYGLKSGMTRLESTVREHLASASGDG